MKKSFLLSIALLLFASLPVLASNPQLSKGGSSVSVPLSSGSLAPGQSAPTVAGQIEIYEGATLVVPPFSPSSLPYVIPNTGGLQVVATAGGPYGYTSVTLQAPSGCSVANYTGCTVVGYTGAGPYVTSGPVDISGGASLPTGTFTASPASIQPGSSSTLTWSTSGATSCTLAAGNGAASSVATSGSQTVSPSATTIYTLTATNSAGSVTAQTTVSVLAPTVVSLSASPTSVPVSSPPPITLTVTLSSAAPAGGATVNFTGSGSGGYVGGIGLSSTSVNVPAGSTTATDTATLTPSAAGSVAFTAAYNGTSATATVPVGSSGSGSTGSTTVGAPGVSASLSPFVIASGGSSVLRWDTSGASTVTVTGVASPSLSGTANVSPAATTVYTVSATNSAGTTTQTVTLTVGGPNAPGGDGASSFMPGSGVTGLGPVTVAATTVAANTYSSDTTIPGVTIPGLTIPGLTLPALPGASPITIPGVTIPGITIPGITIPGYSSPGYTIPGLSLPGISLPGDLKIGIPGVGSIGIPSSWLTQIIAAGVNPSTIATDTLMQSLGTANGKAVFDAGQAVNKAVRDGTYTLQQINTRSDANNQAGLNNVQAAVTNTASVVQGTIQQQTFSIKQTALDTQNVITNMEAKAVTDFKGMLSDLLAYLFIPDPAVLTQFQTQKDTLVNWGPVSFVNSFIAALATPAGDGSLGGGLPGLSVPGFNVNPGDAYIQLNTDGTTTNMPAGVYATNVNVPMDFTPFTNSSSWPMVYKLETAFVTIAFVGAIWIMYWPRQVF